MSKHVTPDVDGSPVSLPTDEPVEDRPDDAPVQSGPAHEVNAVPAQETKPYRYRSTKGRVTRFAIWAAVATIVVFFTAIRRGLDRFRG